MKKLLFICTLCLTLAACEKDNAVDPVNNPKDSTTAEISDTTQLMPLAVGNEWTFRGRPTGGNEIDYTFKIIEKKNIAWYDRAGNLLSTRPTYISNYGWQYSIMPDGVALGGPFEGGSKTTLYCTIFKEPNGKYETGVNVGYGAGTTDYKWTGPLSTNINGKLYYGVWQQEYSAGASYYVRGIGPVQISGIDSVGNYAKLISYKLK